MDRKTYTFDEAFKASLDYFTGDELAAKVWVNKYALKDAFGNIYEESPNYIHWVGEFGFGRKEVSESVVGTRTFRPV